jgi:hypothetical protein
MMTWTKRTMVETSGANDTTDLASLGVAIAATIATFTALYGLGM